MTDWLLGYFIVVGIACTVSVAAAGIRLALTAVACWWTRRPYQPALDRIADLLEATS